MTVRDVLHEAGIQGSDADTALSALSVQCGGDRQVVAALRGHWFHPDLTQHQISAMLISEYGADAGRAAVVIYKAEEVTG